MLRLSPLKLKEEEPSFLLHPQSHSKELMQIRKISSLSVSIPNRLKSPRKQQQGARLTNQTLDIF